MNKIHPCLWFNGQAEEAAHFYTSLFNNAKIGKVTRYGDSGSQASGQKVGSAMTVEFELAGLKIVGLNGGPHFQFTPAFSFFVWCDSEAEIKTLWSELSKNGKVRMGLDQYPWASQYGWTEDRFGVEWQLILSKGPQKVAPAFLFVDKLFGKGEEAINFYSSLFKNSKIHQMTRDEKTKTVMHSVFSLGDQNFVLMEGQGEHNYTFSPAYSLVVNCDSQAELDEYWSKLSTVKEAEQCGWLVDKYGVSWQIVPSVLGKLMSGSPSQSEKVMAALMKMKKIDIKTLEQAHG